MEIKHSKLSLNFTYKITLKDLFILSLLGDSFHPISKYFERHKNILGSYKVLI